MLLNQINSVLNINRHAFKTLDVNKVHYTLILWLEELGHYATAEYNKQNYNCNNKNRCQTSNDSTSYPGGFRSVHRQIISITGDPEG